MAKSYPIDFGEAVLLVWRHEIVSANRPGRGDDGTRGDFSLAGAVRLVCETWPASARDDACIFRCDGSLLRGADILALYRRRDFPHMRGPQERVPIGRGPGKTRRPARAGASGRTQKKMLA
ncbi:hypothetical protein [Afifella pfennigii]|uniref:hypothetical protein n=1 Tax=Afifella pfennigii TaxID=209897 RepID=UPI000478CCC7|nr:hypothetical protein [Afifella pfennigii]